jgi:hypothetical protein
MIFLSKGVRLKKLSLVIFYFPILMRPRVDCKTFWYVTEKCMYGVFLYRNNDMNTPEQHQKIVYTLQKHV